MTDDTWEPWQEHIPGQPCPIPGVFAGDYSVKYFGGGEITFTNLSSDECLGWISGEITHYRLRLHKPAASPAPAVDWEALAREAVGMVYECSLQLKYLTDKFQETGSSNTVMLEVGAFLARARKAGIK